MLVDVRDISLKSKEFILTKRSVSDIDTQSAATIREHP